MAWRDPTMEKRGSPLTRVTDPNAPRFGDIAEEDEAEQAAIHEEGGQRIRAAIMRSGATTQPEDEEWDPAEFALNKETGEIQLANGEIIKSNAPTILQLATLESDNGQPLPTNTRWARGFRPITQSKLASMVDNIDTESDFWGEAIANGKSTMGLAASAIDAMMGSDDPSNAWSRAQRLHEEEQTIGELKASRGRWTSGWDSFISGLGQTAGNIGGSLIMAAPTAIAGTAVGGPAGTAIGAGAALGGAASGFGEQATEFYDTAMGVMQKMDEEQLMQLPGYSQVYMENPEMSPEEVMRETAIRGARAAGQPAALLAAAEGFIGGKLAGNFLAKMGVTKALIGKSGAEAAKELGRGAKLARAGGRMGVGGVLAAGEEMAETGLGQAAGARETGIGSTDPLAHVDPEEGWAASLGGILGGAFGGRSNTSRSPGAILQEKDAAEVAKEGAIGAALSIDGSPEVNNLERNRTARDDQVPRVLAASAKLGEVGNRVRQAAFEAAQSAPGPTGMGARAGTPHEQLLADADAISNVLAQRFGADWFGRIDELAQTPGARHLVGQLMDVERQLSGMGQAVEQQQPQFGGMAPPPVAPGAPTLEGPAFGDTQTPGLFYPGAPPEMGQQPGAQGEMFQPGIGPQQPPPGGPPAGGAPPMQMPPEQAPPEQMQLQEQIQPAAEMPPPNLRERRMAQELGQQERQAASEAAPLALGQRMSRMLEEDLNELEENEQALLDEIGNTDQWLADNKKDPGYAAARKRLTGLRRGLKQLQDEKRKLQRIWEDTKEGEYTEQNIPLGEPLEAPREEAPEGGRPIGVGPPVATEHPAGPPTPVEQAARAATQQKRRGAARGAPPATGVPAQAVAPPAPAQEAVAPTTPEPREDIAAQIEALKDPASGRRAVFVAELPDGKLPKGIPRTGKGLIFAERPGTGLLITTDKKLAQEFRTRKITDKWIQNALNIPESKPEAIASGKPTVVQAVTPKGAVQAEAVTSPGAKGRAAVAVSKQAKPGATVREVPVEAAQERRAKLGEKGKAAAATSKRKEEERTKKERGGEAKPSAAPPARSKADIEAADAERARRLRKVVHELAAEREETQTPAQKLFMGTPHAPLTSSIPADLPKIAENLNEFTIIAGTKGRAVDTRVVAINPQQVQKLANLVAAGRGGKVAEQAMQDVTTAQRVLNDAVKDAEKRMTDRMSAEDKARMEVYKAETLEAENKRHEGAGRPRETPRESPLLYMPLTQAEVLGYLHAVRAQAKAELAGEYTSELTPAKQMLMEILPANRETFNEGKASANGLLRAWAGLSDLQLLQLLPEGYKRLKGRFFPKQVMRGPSEVNHAMLKKIEDMPKHEEGDLTGGELDDAKLMDSGANGTFDKIRAALEALGRAVPRPQPTRRARITSYEDLPEHINKLMEDLIGVFEKGGTKFSRHLHLMSMDEYKRFWPTEDSGNALGLFNTVTTTDRNGKTIKQYVIAIDHRTFEYNHDGMAETMMHELSHLIGEELYSRADDKTKLAMRKAYVQWLEQQVGKTGQAIVREHMTPAMQRLFRHTVNVEYATDFHEWMARNGALYMMDPKRPVRGTVDKFFKALADALKRMWDRVLGRSVNPHDPTFAELLDRWIEGTLEIAPDMPDQRVVFPGESIKTQKRMDVGAEGDVALEEYRNAPGEKLNDQLVRAATDGIKGVRDMFAPGRDRTKDGFMGKSKVGHFLKKAKLAVYSLRDMLRSLEGTEAGDKLKAWMTHMNLKAQTAKKALEPISRWVNEAEHLTKLQKQVLEEVMAEATTFGIHPDLDWEDDANHHLHSKEPRVEGENHSRWAALNQKWRKLGRANPRIHDIYRGMRDAAKKIHEDTHKARLKLIDDSNMSVANKAKATTWATQTYNRQVLGPYFPKKRFGDWIVRVQLPSVAIGKGGQPLIEDGDYFDNEKDAKDEAEQQKALNPGAKAKVEEVEDAKGRYVVRVYHSGVAFYDSQQEAESPKARAELLEDVKKQYAHAGESFEDMQAQMGEEPIIKPVKLAASDYAENKAPGSEFGKELNRMIKDGEISHETAEALHLLEFESLPENSYKKMLLPRRNVIGASHDMVRAYAVGMQGAANNYARVLHGKEIDKNWNDARKAAETHPEAQRIMNEIAENQRLVAQRERESLSNNALSLVSRLSSMYSLAFSVPFTLTNMAQPWMVTVPTLAGMVNTVTGNAVGMVKATKAMKDAYEGTLGFFSRRAVQDFVQEYRSLRGKPGEFIEANFAEEMLNKFAKDDPQLEAVLRGMYNSGLLDYTFISALTDATSGGKVDRTLSKVQRLGMAFPAQVEAMNRLVTAKAAVSLARSEHLVADPEDTTHLSDFANNVVAQTQGDYSAMNRARVFNIPGVGLALQFKQYMQMMYSLFATNVGRAIGPRRAGESDAQYAARRKQGWATLRNLMVTHGAVAGTTGLGPVAAMAKIGVWMAATAMGDEDDEDKWKDSDQRIHEYMTSMFGEEGARVLRNGLPTLLGVDLGDRLSFPDLIDTRFIPTREDQPVANRMDGMLAYAAGAPYSSMKRVAGGIEALMDGDGWKAAMALPNAVRPFVKGARMASEGIVDRDGDTFIPRGELGWKDIAIQSLGGTPADVSRKYEERGQLKSTTARIASARAKIMQDYRNGKATQEEVDAFNRSAPKPFQISRSQLRQAVKGKAEREAGKIDKQERSVRELLGQ